MSAGFTVYIQELASTPQRICGWCRIELAPGRLPATHGICPRCYVQLEREPSTPKGSR